MNQTVFRLFSKLSFDDDGCWRWMGSKVRGGYGQLRVGAEVSGRAGLMVKPHRFLYEAINGAVADGLQLDHLCRNPACCNPAHLEPVTPSENVRRGAGPALAKARIIAFNERRRTLKQAQEN